MYIINTKRANTHLILSLLALLFFVTSIGRIFYKAIADPNPPRTDNGLGMGIVVFGPPFVLIIIAVLVSLVNFYFIKQGKEIKLLSRLSVLLIIPVALLGILFAAATVWGIIR